MVIRRLICKNQRGGPWTSTINITWELVRSATSQAPLQIYWISILKVAQLSELYVSSR